MTKTLLTFGVASTLFAAGPALADVEPTYRIDLTFSSSQAHHILYVTDHSCGELQLKSGPHKSFIKVCANATDDKRVRLGIDRQIRDKSDEQSSQVTLVAASGATFDVLDAKLTVKAQ